MTDYTVTTDFSVKDALSSGDPNKLIVGSQFDTEFDNIATHSATKANKVSGGSANNLLKQDANGDLVDCTSITDDGSTVTITGSVALAANAASVDTLNLGGGALNYLATIHEGDSTNAFLQFTNTTTGTTATDGFLIGIDSSEQPCIYNYEATDVLLYTSNTERVRFHASGNVSIGGDVDLNPMLLHEASSAAVAMRFTNTTTGTTSGDGATIGLGSGETFDLWNYENTAMRFATNNSAQWHIAGTGGLYADGATGGDQGADTINAAGIYVNGNQVNVDALVHSATDYSTGTTKISLPSVFSDNTAYSNFKVIIRIQNISTGAGFVRVSHSTDGSTEDTTGTNWVQLQHNVQPGEANHGYRSLSGAYLELNDDDYGGGAYNLRGEYHAEFTIYGVDATAGYKTVHGHSSYSYGPTADTVIGTTEISGYCNEHTNDITGIYISLDNSATMLYDIQVYGLAK